MIIRNVNLTKVSSGVRNFGWSQFPDPEDLFCVYKIPLCVGSSLRGSKRFPGASRSHGYQAEIMGTDGRRLGSLMVFPRLI